MGRGETREGLVKHYLYSEGEVRYCRMSVIVWGVVRIHREERATKGESKFKGGENNVG